MAVVENAMDSLIGNGLYLGALQAGILLAILACVAAYWYVSEPDSEPLNMVLVSVVLAGLIAA